jgi:GntR family transcriptional regulator/MocR family aminotransferase
MELHLALDRAGPLRAQLERSIRDGIRAGRLRAGSRLPPSRELAAELGISRGVVVEAYSQLVAEGYLVARPGDGTRIANGVVHRPALALGRSSARVERIRFDLRSGIPDLASFPRREWQAAAAAALRDLPDAALSYGSRGGWRGLRIALSDYLGRVRAVVADPDRMLITAGAAHGIGILCRALRARGARRVAVEDPAWPSIPAAVVDAGLELVPITVDGDGLDVDALSGHRVDAVVLSPAHQYPTGTVLSPDRRAELIAWARRSGALIVEDDYDAEYRYDRDPIASLQGLAPDCVAYVGTASKTLAPALRLAWMLVPDDLAQAVKAEHGITRAMPSVVTQAAYATLLEGGTIDKHLRRTRRLYHARRDALVGALSERMPYARVGGASAGLHLMASLSDDADENRIAEAALGRGVAIHTLHRDCAVSGAAAPALLLGYGRIPEAAIPRAIEQLARAARSSGD